MRSDSWRGCSRRDSLPLVEENVSADQHLPFEAPPTKAEFLPRIAGAGRHPSRNSVTIHLRLSLSSASSRAGIPLKRCSTSPLWSEDIRWRRGAPSCREGSWTRRLQTSFRKPGYLRLGLTAISLNGKVMPIQTSSIFMKRGSHEQRNVTIIRDGAGKKAL